MPTAEQLMRRLEQTGPEILEIDKDKEENRMMIMTDIFLRLMHNIGLKQRNVTSENLFSKMSVLDLLTNEEMQQFRIVNPRPELLDPSDLVVEHRDERTKMEKRLARMFK